MSELFAAVAVVGLAVIITLWGFSLYEKVLKTEGMVKDLWLRLPPKKSEENHD